MPTRDQRTSSPEWGPSTLPALLVVFIGGAALMGWLTGLDVLTSLGREWIPMAPSTAILFLLFGGLLLYGTGGRTRESGPVLLGLAALGMAVALTLLVLSSLGVAHPLEHLGISVQGTMAGAPVGHMSPLTAVSFLLGGGALLTLLPPSPVSPRIAGLGLALALALFALAVVLTLAYLLGGPLLYESGFVPPALTTSLAFLALGSALFTEVRSTMGMQQPEAAPLREIPALLVLAAVAGAVGIPLVAYLSFHQYDEDFRVQIEARLTSVADLKVAELARWRAERLGDAKVFAGNPEVQEMAARFLEDPGDAGSRAALQNWLDRVYEAYDYDQVSLLDARGTPRLWAPESGEPPYPLPEDRVRPALNSGRVTITDFHRNEATGEIHLGVLGPIGDVGLVRLRVDPEVYLYPLLQQWPGSSRTAETMLVRQEGDDVVFLTPLRFQENAPLRLRIPVSDTTLPAAMALQGREGLVEGLDYRDVPVVAAIRRVPDSPWYLVARRDRVEIYSPLRARLWWTVGLATFLLAGTTVAVFLAWKRRARTHEDVLSHAEASRRHSEARYRNLFDSIRDAVVVADLDRRIVDCNPAFCELFGYDLDEILGKETSCLYESSEEFQEMGAALREHTEDRSLVQTVRFQTRDGWVFPGETSAFYLQDSEGMVVGFVCLIRDVTARQEALKALRVSEERYRTLIEEAPIGIFTTSSRGVPLRVNTALAGILGFETPEEMLKHYRDLKNELYVNPERREEFLQTLREDGEVDQFEYQARRPGGDTIWLEASARIGHTHPDGSFDIEGFVLNVTDRKEAEAALHQREAMLEGTQELAKVGGWEWDVEDQRMHWTREVFRIHDLDPDAYSPDSEDLIARTRECYPEGARETIQEAFEGCVQQGIPYDLELPFVTTRGRELWIRTVGEPVLDRGRVVKVVGHIMDITEQKQAREREKVLQEQLVQTQKIESVGKLAGGVAHDFNNMLSVILGNTAMAMDQVEESSSVHSDLEEIRRAAERSADLTRQLLAFARRQTITPRILDLNETIEGMLKMLRRLIGENVGLSWDPGSGLWPVYMDPAQLNQILVNLVINARDALEPGGGVTIETENAVLDQAYCETHRDATPGPHVVLTVSDDGRGMSKDILAQAFDPFFTTKPEGEGTGLGLSTVFGIVKQNDGSVYVYSEPNQGTSLKIHLPRAEGVKEAQEESESREVRGGTETLLLVEDEPAVLKLGCRVLEDLGYTVLATESPTEGLELARVHRDHVDLLLTDVIMPDMNGRTLVQELRSFLPELNVIYMSGYPAQVMGGQGVAGSELEFLQKPFTAWSLASKVRKALDRA